MTSNPLLFQALRTAQSIGEPLISAQKSQYRSAKKSDDCPNTDPRYILSDEEKREATMSLEQYLEERGDSGNLFAKIQRIQAIRLSAGEGKKTDQKQLAIARYLTHGERPGCY